MEHEGLLLPERFLDSSTPQPEAFTCLQDQTESSHNLDQPPWTAHLDPQVYRIPEPDAVVRHFSALLMEETTLHAVLVAEVGGQLVGMVEVVRNPDPPDHQILRPEPSAQIHTVVAAEQRNQGIGSALLDAAAEWAAFQGIGFLSVGIHHRNTGAVRFYSRHGYTPSGRSLGRRVKA